MTRPCIILRDTREQDPLCPFRWSTVGGIARRDMIATRDTGLDAGDYSLPGLEHLVTVERKSLPDLWGTLLGAAPDNSVGEGQRALDRFRRELDRMRGHARKWLVIEGDVGSFSYGERSTARGRMQMRAGPTLCNYARRRYEKAHRRGRTPEQNVLSIRSLLSALSVDYGISVEWAGSHQGAAWWVGETLSRVWNEATGGDKAKTVRERGLAEALPWFGMLDGVVGEEKVA